MIIFVVFLMFGYPIWNVNAVGCGTVYLAQKTFKNCTYQCHCKNDALCDKSTGECNNGCRDGWAGPACQYRDVVPASKVYHTGQNTGANAAINAIDRDINTCSVSNPTPNANVLNYWRIEFKRLYLINGLRIIVPGDTLNTFKDFRIVLSMDGVQYNSVCYEHTTQPISSEMEIGCSEIFLAKFVKIILSTTDTAISLCEVYVYSGRELAFNKQTSSSDGDHPRPVNGQVHTSKVGFYDACLEAPGTYAWWSVDLGGKYVIQDVYYGGRYDCCVERQMKGFVVHVQEEAYDSFTTIYTDTYPRNDQESYHSRELMLNRTYDSSILRLTRTNPNGEAFVICDIKAFGECPDGLCGWECTDVCQCSTPPTGSNRIQGTCTTGCKAGYGGALGSQKCDTECDALRWGPDCANRCGNCHTPICDVTTGTCEGGCSGPWKLPLCTESCEDGRYGINCSQTCGHCKNKGACNKTTGVCPNDVCEDGWVFGLCNEQCNEGMFGQNCTGRCGHCSENITCFHVDGYCNTPCKPGYIGHTCHSECSTGYYGTNCSQTCGNCINDQACNTVTGACYGCDPGYNGTLCKLRCPKGTYGTRCNDLCGNCANDTICHHEDGHCLDGCDGGWTQPLCQTAASQQPPPPSLGVPIGAASACVAVVIIGIVVFVFVKRRKAARPKQRNTPIGEHPVQRAGKDKQQGSNHVYENFVDLTTASSTTSIKETNHYDEIRTGIQSSVDEPSAIDDYYNNGSVTKAFPVHRLRELIHRIRQDPVSAHNDFTTLSAGLIFPTTEAMIPANRTKNRYQRMYPYDLTRVKLAIDKGSSDTDYINANYINGYHIDKKYIAAQGAMDDTAVDIWRMVWSENAKVIVMLTECFETGKKKCFPYWSDEETVTFGNYKIQVASTDTFADFVVRTINYTKLSAQQTRSVTHFQFTSWPDKDVPDSPLSVLQFWNKIRKSEDAPHTPWIVHCSAGIGRTGTFIGLDYLYDQGAEKGKIKVREAIETLRQQRTSMVQTKDQYVYLHYVVCEALAPVGKVCKTNDYAGADLRSSLNSVQQLNKEFGMICEETNVVCESDRVAGQDEKKRSGHKQENAHKSRNLATVPADLFRPRLCMAVADCNDFINAVYIPTYRNTKQMIMTQYPLKTTIMDFLRLIWEQEVNTVILLEDLIDNDGAYWPLQGSKVSFGPFTAELVEHTDEEIYTYRKIKYTVKGKNDQREVNQYQFNHWKGKQDIPTDTSSVLQLISDIQSKSMNIPVAVQCMDGATRSGLFAVIWCVLDRIKSDSEIAIAETVRATRMIRPQTITGVEQYRFLHSLVQEYMESFDIYVNAL